MQKMRHEACRTSTSTGRFPITHKRRSHASGCLSQDRPGIGHLLVDCTLRHGNAEQSSEKDGSYPVRSAYRPTRGPELLRWLVSNYTFGQPLVGLPTAPTSADTVQPLRESDVNQMTRHTALEHKYRLGNGHGGGRLSLLAT